MKKKILAMFLSLCIVIGLMPTGAMAALEDGSQVVRVQDTDAWYSDATKAFRTKNSYWFDQIKSQPDGYAVDATKKTVTISAPEALVWWAKQVNQGTSFAGYTVYIMADLDMSAHYWTPICTGKYEKNSEGKWVVTENNVLDNTTICGNGHTITGLATSTGLRGPNQNSQPGDGSNCYYDAAFIGYSCCDIKICDLAFDGARIAITEPFDEVTTKYGSSMVAVVVGAQNKGSLTLNNVTVNDADVLAMQKASAFVGNLMGNSTLTVNKCAVTNSTFSAYFMVAPIASYGATTQVKVNGIQLKNNTINVVEQASQTYSYDETLRAEYWDGDLNASTTTVFYDTTKPLVSVAELDGYGFVNLGDAITAAETGDTIMLLSDVAVDTTITVDKNVTINLNGYTITGVSGSGDSAIGRRVFYVKKGTLNLTGEGTVTTAAENDSTFANNSSVIRVGDGSAWEKEGSDTAGLVVDPQVTIAAPASYGIGAFGSATEETVTIYGKVLATGSASAVSGNGLDTLTGTTINIEDGAEISAKNAVAIYHPQVGTMTIGAASITGTGGIEAKAGSTTVTVDGATITATGEVDHIANSDGTSTDGYAIAAVENDDYAGNATIRIENGHFIGPVAVLTDNPVVENKDATIEISGGNFSEPVNKEYLADAISAELYSLRNTATPYSYYPSVEEAQAAAQPGDVVTDLSTVTENAKKFTVVFDYGNGTKKELTMPEGANASLPSLNDRGYNHFQGWNDGTTTYAGGTKVTISKDTTFTAVWSYIPPANPNYKITIGDTANGTVTADPAAAKAGATVTLTATPDEGYTLGSLTVTDRFGDAVKVTENADGTYTFTMPNGQVTVNATFVETEEPAPAEPFPDVDENDWFYDEVVYVYENGLMNGVENNQFAPNTATNRAMLATILYRLAGQPDVSGDLPFTDVAAGTWYTDAVLWAAQNGIVNGLGENTFAPMNTLTREQLVTMLYRYAEAEGYDVSAAADLSGYPDAGKVQTYAQEAMSWAVAEGIVEGMDGNLNPAGSATRAQIATILMRFCEGVAK